MDWTAIIEDVCDRYNARGHAGPWHEITDVGLNALISAALDEALKVVLGQRLPRIERNTARIEENVKDEIVHKIEELKP